LNRLVLRTLCHPLAMARYLLRWKYAEAIPQGLDCIIVNGAANRPHGQTSLQGQYMLTRLDDFRRECPDLALTTTVVFISGNSFFGEGITEAQALYQAFVELGLDRHFSGAVCLDPMSLGLQEELRQWLKKNGSIAERRVDLGQLSVNTWTGMLKAVPYLRYRGFRRIVTLAHPNHNTWCWPLLRHVAGLTDGSYTFGLMNSNQGWLVYDRRSPQKRWRSLARWLAYSIRARGKQILNGWIVWPYL
jgi:hypothetical protein